MTETAPTASPAASVDKKTRASSVYLQLRMDVINGRLLPGSKLNIRQLSEKFSSGLSPVREALNRLSAEGLVDQVDNRGFAVQNVSVPDLIDLTQARCWLNEIGLRESIKKGDAAWEEQVLVACHRLGRITRNPVIEDTAHSPDWNYAHKAFHQSLISACGSDWLISNCSQLFDTAERYRSLARLAGVSRSDPRDEHQEIMRAAIDRQSDHAIALMTAHLRKTEMLVRSVFREQTAN